MCALLDEANHPEVKPQESRKKTFIVFFIIVLVGLGAVQVYNTYFAPPKHELAVSVLVDPDPRIEGVLPHAIDPATEFEDSLDTVAEGIEAPEFRDTGAKTTGEVVGVEQPPLEVMPEDEPALGITAEPAETQPETLKKISQIQKTKDVVAKSNAQPEIAQYNISENKALEVKSSPKDWQGIVLVPDTAQMSKAYSSDVTLTRIEAHPLTDNRLRVWTRVFNETGRTLSAKIACNFRSTGDENESSRFTLVRIPRDQAVDIYFVSPMTFVKAYTILVK